MGWWVVLSSFVFCVLVVRVLWRWRRFVSVVHKLPMTKLRFYHVFGHAQGFVQLRTRKMPFPYHVYDFMALNAYSSLFRSNSLAAVWAVCFPMVQIHRADSVQTILSHSTELQKAFTYRFLRAWLGNGLLLSDGSKWKSRRKLLTPAFHFHILQDFVPIFDKQARVLADVLNQVSEDEYTDIVPLITKCSFDIMCETMLGVETHAQTHPSCPYLDSVNILTSALFERMFNPLLWPDFIFRLSPLGRKFVRHAKRAQHFTYEIISEKKRAKLSSPGEEGIKKRALLDLMLEEHLTAGSDLSESDIREEIDTFTFEGHDTTAMGMSWALYLVGLHPDVQEKIRQELDTIFGGDTTAPITVQHLREMKYLECVLKESLRLYPPVPYFGRQIQEDLEFQGLLVPKGSTCMIFPYFLHRDPEVFPNPEKFDPERFAPENSAGRNPFSYIPFSAGPRNCIGQRFALLEEKVVLANVLRKFRIESLDPRDKVQIMNEIVLRPLNGLRLRIRHRDHEPRKPPLAYYGP